MIVGEYNSDCPHEKVFEVTFESCLVEVQSATTSPGSLPASVLCLRRTTSRFLFCAVRSLYLVALMDRVRRAAHERSPFIY